jgi:hypothetical protein
MRILCAIVSEQSREAKWPGRRGLEAKGEVMPRLSLARVSTEALKGELLRRLEALPKLIAQRDELSRQIAELEALAAVEEAPGRPRARAARKGTRKAIRAKNPVTLSEALGKALKGKENTSIAEAAEAVLASGYKSKSKDFSNLVAMTLSKDKRFERTGRGQYRVSG